jgi:hypothetical protein
LGLSYEARRCGSSSPKWRMLCRRPAYDSAGAPAGDYLGDAAGDALRAKLANDTHPFCRQPPTFWNHFESITKRQRPNRFPNSEYPNPNSMDGDQLAATWDRRAKWGWSIGRGGWVSRMPQLALSADVASGVRTTGSGRSPRKFSRMHQC